MVDGPELINLEQASLQLGVSLRRVTQLLSDGDLVALRDEVGAKSIPAEFVLDGAVVKGLPAVITLLRDVHYEDGEIVDWLFRADDSLPGTPIQALRENRGREVKRRAQAAGF